MDAHETLKRRPMPAYRDPEARKREIIGTVGIFMEFQPELLEDITQLTELPPIDAAGLPEGASHGSEVMNMTLSGFGGIT